MICVIWCRPAAKSAAHKVGVKRNIFDFKPKGFSRGRARPHWVLCTSPKITFAIPHPGGSVHRLHTGMGQIRHFIFSFINRGRFGFSFTNAAGLSQCLFLPALYRFCILRKYRALISFTGFRLRPLDIHIIKGLFGLPITISDNSDIIFHIIDRNYARHALCLGGIHIGNALSMNRGRLYCRIFHAIDLSIHRKFCRAVDFGRNIHTRQTLAD